MTKDNEMEVASGEGGDGEWSEGEPCFSPKDIDNDSVGCSGASTVETSGIIVSWSELIYIANLWQAERMAAGSAPEQYGSKKTSLTCLHCKMGPWIE